MTDKVTGVRLGKMKDELKKEAKRENRTLSGLIKHILKRWLNVKKNT